MTDDPTRSQLGPSDRALELVLVSGDVIRPLALREGQALVLGRAREADVTIDDAALSRRHLAVHADRGEVLVEELGSRNGTRVRGVPIAKGARIRLAPGDVVELGDAMLVLRRSDLTRAPSASGAPSTGVASRILVVGHEARWFEPSAGDRVELGRRGALRLVLLALVERHVAKVHAGLPVDALFAAGWPGEQIHPESASARVYTTVQRLRALGLDAFLVTRDDGYLLDPAADVRWA